MILIIEIGSQGIQGCVKYRRDWKKGLIIDIIEESQPFLNI